MTQLSTHFSLAEATHSNTAVSKGIDNSPGDKELEAMEHSASQLEIVRELLGDKPLKINSWYRCPALNKAVGGSSTSSHVTGYAIDFAAPEDVRREWCDKIVQSGIKFDQVIYEPSWIHISFDPRSRGQYLKMSGGKYTTLVPL